MCLGKMCVFLNRLLAKGTLAANICAGLPEDFALRGQSRWYFSDTWVSNTIADDDERVVELPLMAESCSQRLVWLGAQITTVSGPILQ